MGLFGTLLLIISMATNQILLRHLFHVRLYEVSVRARKVVSNLPNFCGIYSELCIVNERSFHLHFVDARALRVGSLLRCKVAGN